jgi:hypothetical protein
MQELYRQLSNAAESISLKMISDEKCCELLAWLYVFGGGQENTVFDYRLNTDINTAQKRLNIFGGEMPNAELIPMLKQKVQKAQNTLKGEQTPEWLTALCEKYKIKAKQ